MERTMDAKTFEHLMNGGAAMAGVDGLEGAIRIIEAAQWEIRRELSLMADRRSEALLADFHDAALDKLEKRENSLYREIEKGDLQIAELHLKLAEYRNVGYQSRLEKHRSAVAEAASNLDAAIVAAVQANDEMIAAFEDAKRDLGTDTAHRFLPVGIGFAGLLDERCLNAWRLKLQEQNDRIARASSNRPQIVRFNKPLGLEITESYEMTR
jgi:hypothetical protein